MSAGRFALFSVSDKTGLTDIARAAAAAGYCLLSTGGTARALRDAGLAVTDVADHTGFPEMMDGRVKTLHPKIHGGLLYRRDLPAHLEQARQAGIPPIDLVVVNLYPFEQVSRRADATFAECVENIDIGGPSMLRSAAKNHQSVTVLCDPADYAEAARQLASGGTTAEFRARLAAKVFAHTAYYDSLIADYLRRHLAGADGGAGEIFPERTTWPMRRAAVLRYGENPHQSAALYGPLLEEFEQLQGKELSYNNILDTAAALDLINEFDEPTLAILKHTNPCGVGTAQTLSDAWEKALATDREAPFGGIIVMNRECDGEVAEAIADIFSEVIIAPEFSDEARIAFSRKKNLRLLRMRKVAAQVCRSLSVRSVRSGWLVQEPDALPVNGGEWKCVTRRQPSPEEWRALTFGWRVVKHVKSNAIVYAAADRTLGIGAGQMSRVDASRLAVWKAGNAGLDLRGSAVASDAFFPFADGVLAAARAGATAFIQPGGSVRDAEVIAACDEHNLAMVFTGRRHFRH
jgi:phosphoribosylaminoimidazolecarboxamide formyltransferase/IMP cyclohydrolase